MKLYYKSLENKKNLTTSFENAAIVLAMLVLHSPNDAAKIEQAMEVLDLYEERNCTTA